MRSKGFRLTAEDVYSVNRASMKDAVVSVGGFCTGEIVSDRGLLLTNHHCGYPAIQRLSSVDHDYLTHGFWAPLRHRGAARRGSSSCASSCAWRRSPTGWPQARRPQRSRPRPNARARDTAPRSSRCTTATSTSSSSTSSSTTCASWARPLVDRRKFGGDTDNWIWPRHTGDFSVFRICRLARQPSGGLLARENVPLPSAPPLRRFSSRRRGGWRLHHDLRFPGDLARSRAQRPQRRVFRLA